MHSWTLSELEPVQTITSETANLRGALTARSDACPRRQADVKLTVDNSAQAVDDERSLWTGARWGFSPRRYGPGCHAALNRQSGENGRAAAPQPATGLHAGWSESPSAAACHFACPVRAKPKCPARARMAATPFSHSSLVHSAYTRIVGLPSSMHTSSPAASISGSMRAAEHTRLQSPSPVTVKPDCRSSSSKLPIVIILHVSCPVASAARLLEHCSQTLELVVRLLEVRHELLLLSV